MAHRLAGNSDSERHQRPETESTDRSPTAALSRRKYLTLSAASAAVLATGAFGGAASSSGSTYYTDFSGGSL